MRPAGMRAGRRGGAAAAGRGHWAAAAAAGGGPPPPSGVPGPRWRWLAAALGAAWAPTAVVSSLRLEAAGGNPGAAAAVAGASAAASYILSAAACAAAWPGYAQQAAAAYRRTFRPARLAAGFAAGAATLAIYLRAAVALGVARPVVASASAAAAPGLGGLGAWLWVGCQGLALGLAVAAAEEALFRGWLEDALAASPGRVRARAAATSSLAFAAAHADGAAFLGLFLLGLALAEAKRAAGGSLDLPVGVHAGLVAAHFWLAPAFAFAGGSWLAGPAGSGPLAGALAWPLLLALALALRLLPRAREAAYLLLSFVLYGV